MLVLSRKVGQQLIVDLGEKGLVRVTVTEVKGERIKVAIQARKDVRLRRGELPHDGCS